MPTRSRVASHVDRIGDLAIHTLEEGSGPPLVFFHGWSVHAGSSRHFRQLFRDRYRIIVPTLIGFGRSSPLPHPEFSLEEYGQVFSAWFEHHRLTNVTLVGHSLGGAVALASAGRIGDRIAQLFLLDSLGVPIVRTGKEWAREWAKKRISNWRMSVVRSMQNLDLPLFGHAIVRPLDLFRLAMLARTLDARSYASGLKLPTTILWGDRDEYIPRTIGEGLHGLITGSQLHVVTGDHDWPLLRPEPMERFLSM